MEVRGMNALIHSVYVLLSLKDGLFYIGMSSNLLARLRDHESGSVLSTNPRRPFVIVHTEHYFSKSDALRREDYFKSAKGKRVLTLMLRDSLRELRESTGGEDCP
jgi:putative endonuclease